VGLYVDIFKYSMRTYESVR